MKNKGALHMSCEYNIKLQPHYIRDSKTQKFGPIKATTPPHPKKTPHDISNTLEKKSKHPKPKYHLTQTDMPKINNLHPL